MPGHVPDWVRKNQGKVQHLADGGEAHLQEAPPSISVQGAGSTTDNGYGFGGRVSKRFDMDDGSSVTVGMQGHSFKVKTPDGDIGKTKVTGADLSYRAKDKEYSLSVDKDEQGKNRYMAKFTKNF